MLKFLRALARLPFTGSDGLTRREREDMVHEADTNGIGRPLSAQEWAEVHEFLDGRARSRVHA